MSDLAERPESPLNSAVDEILGRSRAADLQHVPPSPMLTPRQGNMRTDAYSVITDVDHACTVMLGHAAEDLVGMSTLALIHGDDHDTAIASWIDMLQTPGASARSVIRYTRADGSWFWAEITNHNRLHDLGWVERQVVDVSDKIDAELNARTTHKVIRGIADVLPSGIAQFDENDQLVFSNDRWNEITGLVDGGGKASFATLLIEPSPERLYDSIRERFRAGSGIDTEITIVAANDGGVRRCRLSVRPLFSDDGSPEGYVVCLDDITDSWRMHQRLTERATRDATTGLANRSAVVDFLDSALASARQTGHATAVIFVDLNDFKRVNDVLGHSAGDSLLRQIGESIGRAIRPRDLVARHGGDEFVVVCTDVASRADSLDVARRVLRAATGRFDIGGKIVDTTASCGVSIDFGGTHTAERMIAEADLAMYERKTGGYHDPGLFRPALFEEQREELNRDSALAQASDDGSLEVHYQPIVELDGRYVIGFEALVRWNFDGRLIGPDGFIGLAERRGLISRIGARILDDVCAQASTKGRPDLQWSVNVSPLQLRDPSFDETVARTLERHALPAQQLALEITEGVLLTHDNDTRELLRRLRELGVKLVVDDFGTGYASLDYLRTFPLDCLKIDRSFTADIERPRTRTIVSSVVDLAKSLGVQMVIEGIETEHQAEIVAATGARAGQGYLFGRPARLS